MLGIGDNNDEQNGPNFYWYRSYCLEFRHYISTDIVFQ